MLLFLSWPRMHQHYTHILTVAPACQWRGRCFCGCTVCSRLFAPAGHPAAVPPATLVLNVRDPRPPRHPRPNRQPCLRCHPPRPNRHPRPSGHPRPRSHPRPHRHPRPRRYPRPSRYPRPCRYPRPYQHFATLVLTTRRAVDPAAADQITKWSLSPLQRVATVWSSSFRTGCQHWLVQVKTLELAVKHATVTYHSVNILCVRLSIEIGLFCFISMCVVLNKTHEKVKTPQCAHFRLFSALKSDQFIPKFSTTELTWLKTWSCWWQGSRPDQGRGHFHGVRVDLTKDVVLLIRGLTRLGSASHLSFPLRILSGAGVAQ